MKKVVAKYLIKIGQTLIPKDTVGEVVDIEEVRANFPKIEYKEGSEQVSVKFLGLKACIVHTSQIVYYQD
jgi:hypothetical protein